MKLTRQAKALLVLGTIGDSFAAFCIASRFNLWAAFGWFAVYLFVRRFIVTVFKPTVTPDLSGDKLTRVGAAWGCVRETDAEFSARCERVINSRPSGT